MNYLYHAVPREMRGTTLYPLTELAAREPELAASYDTKYDHRPHVREQTIPALGHCAWNAVIFMTSVHPGDIKEALLEAGARPSIKLSYYQIDPHDLNPANLSVFLFPYQATWRPVVADDFAPYREEDLPKYAEIPQITRDYYAQEIADGHKVRLLYKNIPHILHKGPIDVTNNDIITV